MIVKINKNECKHIIDMSCYNDNYYKLPVEINDCNILYESYNGAESYEEISLGNIVNGNYSPIWYLHDNYEIYGIYVFDDKKMSKEHKWI